MSNVSKRAEGIAEKLSGRLKKTIGRILGSEQMAAEGAATETKGKVREESAKAAERTEGLAEQAGGAVKAGVGKVVGSEKLTAEGEAQKVEGKVREETNR